MRAARVELALVFHGGCLLGPLVLTTREVEGRVFVRLSKCDSTLTRFLTGKRAKLNPLAGLPTFKDLALLRNIASAMPKPVVSTELIDDLGLDDDPGLDRRERRRSPYSKLPERIVEICVGDRAIAVLSGYGNLDVFMEATSENMSMLHSTVSTELAAAAAAAEGAAAAAEGAGATPAKAADSSESTAPTLESDSPESASGSPAAPRTPPPGNGSLNLDVDTPMRQAAPSAVRADGLALTWIENRNAWVLRYRDENGMRRQKRFRASECGADVQTAARSWLAEYKEACRCSD